MSRRNETALSRRLDELRDRVAGEPEEGWFFAAIAEQVVQQRRARDLSQATLAEALETDQGSISRLEQRTDMHISTLRRYVEALGGTLDIVARFPDGDVRITEFRDLQ